MATTPNRANRYPVGTDAANVPQRIQDLATDLDNVANIYSGTLASMPAASAAPGHGAGSPGSFWLTSDTGELFVSMVGAWIKVTTEPGVPLGGMIDYAGVGDPADTRYMLAEGRALARAGIYAPLFTAIGTAYGAGDGSTTFNIPDKRGRVSVGQDNMGTAQGAAGRIPNTANTRGQGHGEELHASTPNETPVKGHGHADTIAVASANVPDHTHTTPFSPGGYLARADTSAELVLAEGTSLSVVYTRNLSGAVNGGAAALAHAHTKTGSVTAIADGANGAGHNNVQPGQADNKLIRVR